MFKFVLPLMVMASLLAAAEIKPIVPKRVIDAMTLGAFAKLGDQAVPISIGLSGITAPTSKEAPEAAEISRRALYNILATGRRDGQLFPVVLEMTGDRFGRDDRGRILAIVSFPPPRAIHEISMDEPRLIIRPVSMVQQETIQEYMVRNGWAVLEAEAILPASLKERLVALQKTASNANIGLWKDYRTAMELASQKRPLP